MVKISKSNGTYDDVANIKIKGKKNSLGIKKHPRNKLVKKNRKISNSNDESMEMKVDEESVSESELLDKKKSSLNENEEENLHLDVLAKGKKNVEDSNKTDEEQIKELFAECGEIENVKFLFRKDVTKADVKFFSYLAENKYAARATKLLGLAKYKHAIFVGNLKNSPDLKTQLLAMFSKIGTIENVHLCVKSPPFRSHAFIDFKNADEFESALKLNGRIINDQPIVVKKKTTSFNENQTIFVKNLSLATTREDLENSFSRFGEIESVICPDKTKTALITYLHNESAEKAINYPNEISVDGQILKVLRFSRRNKPENKKVGLTIFEKKMLSQINQKLHKNGYKNKFKKGPFK